MRRQKERAGWFWRLTHPQYVKAGTQEKAGLQAPESPRIKPYLEQWRAVASATHIARARIRSVGITPGAGRRWDDVRVELEVTSYLAGTPIYASVGDRLSASGRIPKNLSEQIKEWKDRDVVAILWRSDTRHGKGLSLATSFDAAIMPATDTIVENVRKEWQNQNIIATQFARLPVAKPDAYHEPVKQLIARTLQAATQRQAFIDLERMGRKASPSMIRQMDDFRPLAVKHITLALDRQAFEDDFDPRMYEGVAHYAPDLVVDALDTLLMQITHGDFSGTLLNAATSEPSEAERRKVIAGWRVYLFYRQAEFK